VYKINSVIYMRSNNGVPSFEGVHTLQISENRVMRTTFGSKKEGLVRTLEHFIRSNFTIYTGYQILLRY
jgi:hypothetical protein